MTPSQGSLGEGLSAVPRTKTSLVCKSHHQIPSHGVPNHHTPNHWTGEGTKNPKASFFPRTDVEGRGGVYKG